MSEWQTAKHALGYFQKADRVPHRVAGETALLDELPETVHRVLDLGAGDGRLLDLVLRARPTAVGVAVDFSPPMLERLQQRFDSAGRVQVIAHNLEEPLPNLGTSRRSSPALRSTMWSTTESVSCIGDLGCAFGRRCAL